MRTRKTNNRLTPFLMILGCVVGVGNNINGTTSPSSISPRDSAVAAGAQPNTGIQDLGNDKLLTETKKQLDKLIEAKNQLRGVYRFKEGETSSDIETEAVKAGMERIVYQEMKINKIFKSTISFMIFMNTYLILQKDQLITRPVAKLDETGELMLPEGIYPPCLYLQNVLIPLKQVFLDLGIPKDPWANAYVKLFDTTERNNKQKNLEEVTKILHSQVLIFREKIQKAVLDLQERIKSKELKPLDYLDLNTNARQLTRGITAESTSYRPINRNTTDYLDLNTNARQLTRGITAESTSYRTINRNTTDALDLNRRQLTRANTRSIDSGLEDMRRDLSSMQQQVAILDKLAAYFQKLAEYFANSEGGPKKEIKEFKKVSLELLKEILSFDKIGTVDLLFNLMENVCLINEDASKLLTKKLQMF